MVMLFNCYTKRKIALILLDKWPRKPPKLRTYMFVSVFFFLVPQNILAFAYRSVFSQSTLSRAHPFAINRNNTNAKFKRWLKYYSIVLVFWEIIESKIRKNITYSILSFRSGRRISLRPLNALDYWNVHCSLCTEEAHWKFSLKSVRSKQH